MRKIVLSLAVLGLLLAAVDQVRADFIYWADENTDDIRRANLDGTGQQVLVTGQNRPTGLALDTTNGKMYWVNQFGHTLWSANQDGTGQQVLLTGLTEPTNIALDLVSGKIYIAALLSGQ
jgi:hypothetical protein